MLKINYCSEVKVKLDGEGRAILKMRYGFEPRIDEDGFYECPLWILMKEFGSLIKEKPDIFKDRCIYMQESDVDMSEKRELNKEFGITQETAILISAYTTHLLTKDFMDVWRFCEKLLGRELYPHEFSLESVNAEIKKKCEPMILEMIKNIEI